MKRFLVAVLAVLASAQLASAALLVHYKFDGSTEPTIVDSRATSLTYSQSNWSNITSGTEVVSANLTAAVPSITTQALANSNGKFYLGAPDGLFARFDSFEFEIRKQNTSSLGEVRYNAFYRLVSYDPNNDEITGVTSYAALGPSLSTTTSATSTPVSITAPPLPFTLPSGTYVEVVVNAWRLSGSGTNFVAVAGLDNVKFNGAIVPEPASMAIFAVLGLPVALKRFRRK